MEYDEGLPRVLAEYFAGHCRDPSGRGWAVRDHERREKWPNCCTMHISSLRAESRLSLQSRT